MFQNLMLSTVLNSRHRLITFLLDLAKMGWSEYKDDLAGVIAKLPMVKETATKEEIEDLFHCAEELNEAVQKVLSK